MGLDVTAYESVAFVKGGRARDFSDEEYDRDDRTVLYQIEHFASATDGLADGLYAVSGEVHAFRAGSYGGYNQWREQLAALVGTTPEATWANPQPGPFVELIHNSDCEGFIGPVTAAKLAQDFADWEPQVKGDDWFVSRYQHWKKAFEIAAKGGAVKLT